MIDKDIDKIKKLTLILLQQAIKLAQLTLQWQLKALLQPGNNW